MALRFGDQAIARMAGIASFGQKGAMASIVGRTGTRAARAASDFKQGRHRPLRPVSLNYREQQLLDHFLQGLTNKEIAKHLNLRVGTVKHYARQLFRKMRVRNRLEVATQRSPAAEGHRGAFLPASARRGCRWHRPAGGRRALSRRGRAGGKRLVGKRPYARAASDDRADGLRRPHARSPVRRMLLPSKGSLSRGHRGTGSRRWPRFGRADLGGSPRPRSQHSPAIAPRCRATHRSADIPALVRRHRVRLQLPAGQKRVPEGIVGLVHNHALEAPEQ